MSMQKRLTPYVVLLVAAAIVVACGTEQALLVSPQLVSAPPLGLVVDTSGTQIHPLRRDHATDGSESWSFDVGPAGTVVRHPATGLTIKVPRGAVSALTHITVTALKGAPIAYRFEPHGLQFAVPLELIQSLHGARLGARSAAAAQLFAGYFTADSLPTDENGDVRVIEILPVQIDVRGNAAVLSIHHFSGYTWASAAADSIGLSIR
jgi:hypothetical protein